jgi:YggT family protein
MATALLTKTLDSFIQIYMLLLIVRILLTLFQTLDWANQIISFLSPITDPYLNIFRSFIPPIGAIDISPILAILVLQIVGGLISGLASSSVGYF